MGVAWLLCTLGLMTAFESPAQPPLARQVPHPTVWHGEQVNDPFFWLRNRSDPEVIKYLEAENAYTEAMTKDLHPFADKLYREMLGHIKQTDLSVPVRRGAYYYYARMQEGKQYPVRCRKKAAGDGSFDEKAAEMVLLDQSELAKGLQFLSVAAFVISDDANLLAYTTDTTGYRQYALHVKDLRTGVTLPDTAERVTSVEWCADNRTLLYTTEDPVTKRSNLVWRHPLGDESEPIYREKDQLYTVHLGRSKDLKMVFLRSSSTDTWETRYLPSDKPDGTFTVVLPRVKGHKYAVEHRDGRFYLRTNKDARNFRLVTAPVADPTPASWKEVLPQRNDVLLDGVEVFRDYLVATEKTAALEHFRIFDFASEKWHEVSFPENVYAASLMGTPEYASTLFRFAYQSPVTPESVYDYDMAARKQTLRKRQEVPGFDSARYVTERQWAVARDGVKVPLSLVYRKGFKKDGSAPLFLYGYGSYGFGMSAGFNSSRLVLLDRGMVFAIAHIRGGNEMGEGWHDDGMLLKKKNTFFDFIDSAEWLLANGYTSKERLVIEGGMSSDIYFSLSATIRIPDHRPALGRANDNYFSRSGRPSGLSG